MGGGGGVGYIHLLSFWLAKNAPGNTILPGRPATVVRRCFGVIFSLAVLSLASNDRRPYDAYLCVLIVVYSLCHLCYVGQQIASI